MTRLREALPGFLDRFEVVIDGGMVTRSKPDPEGYRLAASRIGIPPADCIVFEDSLQGLQAGRAAGGRVVGLTTTWPEEAVAPYADLTAGSLAELTPLRLAALFD